MPQGKIDPNTVLAKYNASYGGGKTLAHLHQTAADLAILQERIAGDLKPYCTEDPAAATQIALQLVDNALAQARAADNSKAR